jgi:hypothetical protein
VGSVAEWRLAGVFALAPGGGLFFEGFEFDRLQAGALVGAIAKRLMGGSPA